jgi:hypothetical protein
MKTCSKCYETKSLAEFSDIVKRGKPYKLAQCRVCVRAYQKALLDANPERRKEYNHTNSSEISRLEWNEIKIRLLQLLKPIEKPTVTR